MRSYSRNGCSFKRTFAPSRICIIVLLPLIIFFQSSCEKERISITRSFYAPLKLDDWEVSAPEDHGLDTVLVKEMYQTAGEIDHLYSLLIVKDGYLVAERYFNGQSITTARPIASVTKSYTSTHPWDHCIESY